MEEPLERVLKDARELDSELLEAKSTIVGVLCVDNDGLCIAAEGQIDSRNSGLIGCLTKLAAEVEPANEEQPVVVLDRLDKTQLVLKREGDVNVAILKNQSTLPK